MEYKIDDICFTYFNDEKYSRIEIRQIGKSYLDRIAIKSDLSFIAFKQECEQWYNEKRNIYGK